MTFKLRIPGIELLGERGPLSAQNDHPGKSDHPDNYASILGTEVIVATDVRVNRSTGKPVVSEAHPHDLIKLTWQGGIVEWIRADSARQHFEQPSSTTNGSTDNSIDIPNSKMIQTVQGDTRSLELEAVKHIRLKTIEEIKKRAISTIANAAAGWVAPPIIKQIEERLIPNPGLYHLKADGSIDLNRRAEALIARKQKPYLVLIHGAFSYTQGSFGELFNSPEWSHLYDAYGEGHVVTLEHHTVTENPAENALTIAKAFQEESDIHILSHSRGGLVGDLLCRHYPDDDNELEQFFSGPQYKASRKTISALKTQLRKTPLNVRRFVRVAAPAAGTLLASEHLNTYLNVILNVLGHDNPLPSTHLLEFVEAITNAIIATGLNAEQLPGLEAMMPHTQQGFVPFLNCAEPKGTDLAVIAGHVISGGGFFDRIKEFFSTLYFLEPNDFVVDSASMFRGVPRESAIGFYHEAPKANHFSYFSQLQTRTLMVNFLADNNSEGFRLLEDSEDYGGLSRTTQRSIPSPSNRPDGTKPVVFLLPGIMGTYLAREKPSENQRLWINLRRLAWNGLDEIAFDRPNIVSDGLYADAYEPLYRYLKKTYHVIPFGFDWRSPIEKAAQALSNEIHRVLQELDDVTATNIQAEKSQIKQPVRIIAHSMGGLVARTFIANNPTTWQRMKQQGARLIMMGTPNFGSYVPARVFTQQDRLMKRFSRIAIRNSLQSLTEVVRRYPGLVEMLPTEKQSNLLKHSSWKGITQYAPEALIIEKALAFREKLDKTARDSEAMVYIAGHDHETPAEMTIVDGEPKFRVTGRGDGTVTWALGMLPNVSTYYIEARHGEMPSHRESFAGFLDLLNTGETHQLLTTAPVTQRSQEEALFEPSTETDEEGFRCYPNTRDIIAPFVGRWHSKTGPQRAPISLAVVNGDIREAEWPVLVGHYQGDPIVGEEETLDQLHDYKLSRDLKLGRYPSAIGSVRLYKKNRKTGEMPNKMGGVIVTGLGVPGQLTRNVLEAALRAALMEYALAHIAEETAPVNILSVCSLLISSYGGRSITTEEMVIALGNAAHEVNQTLEAQDLIECVRIGNIQFFELYQDVAIEAAHVTRRLQEQRPKQFIAKPSIVPKPTALLRRPYYPESNSRNRRIHIRTQGTSLNYEFTTDLARNEHLSRNIQWDLVNLLLADSTSTGTETLSTLFRYLLPYQFVNKTTNLPDIVLDLDPDAAKIPWELLDVSTNLEGNREPIGVRVSMLRTLSTITPRETPRRSSERRALVIGEPAGISPSLPGALAEAQTVAALLQKKQLKVTTVLRANPREIISALYAYDYDIVHVAAHGEFSRTETDKASEHIQFGKSKVVTSDYQNTRNINTGVVLADGLYLRSDELANLQAVPSIVFLNCCHLGKIDGNPVGQMHLRQPGQFSASLAEHLVEMGVGVVVVAGWAVTDGPAKVFAERFYTELLVGKPLSYAVRNARLAAYHECAADDVTWGAFQVYGDSDYILHLAGRRNSGRSTRSPNFVASDELSERSTHSPNFVASDELLGERSTHSPNFVASDELGERSTHSPNFVALDELTEYILDIGTRGRERGEEGYQQLLKELKEIKQTIPPNWRKDGKVWDAFGESYMSLGAYQEAIEAYKKAIEKSGANIRTIEQLANAQSRIGERLIQAEMGSEEQNFTQAQEVLKEAYQRLKALIKIAPSSERFCLLGATYKRDALTRQGHEREERFRDAREQYEEAIALKPSNLYYPLENKIGLNLLLLENEPANPQSDKNTDSKSPRNQLLQEIERDIETMRQNLANCTDVWAKSSKVNVELLRFLAYDSFDTARDIYNSAEIAQAYYDVINSFTSTSEKERESVIKQIQLFAHYAKSKSVQDAAQQVLDKFQSINRQ